MKAKKKLSASTIVWCWVCIVANVAIMAFTSDALANAGNEAVFVIQIIIVLINVVGYALLLAGKRVGFFLVCIVSITILILNIINRNIIEAGFGLINPIITWLLIKNRWNTWDEIDSEKQRAKENYTQQYKEHYNIDSFFFDHGKKIKTWSIVNMCIPITLVTILPILAFAESEKAQKAQDAETHDKHIKKAKLFNLCSYIAFVPFILIMLYLESIGVVVR